MVESWVVDCGLWIVDCGLWTVDCGLWIVDCGLWIVDVWMRESLTFRTSRIGGEGRGRFSM